MEDKKWIRKTKNKDFKTLNRNCYLFHVNFAKWCSYPQPDINISILPYSVQLGTQLCLSCYRLKYRYNHPSIYSYSVTKLAVNQNIGPTGTNKSLDLCGTFCRKLSQSWPYCQKHLKHGPNPMSWVFKDVSCSMKLKTSWGWAMLISDQLKLATH